MQIGINGAAGPDPRWHKSSHCAGKGNCVEIAWRRGAGGILIMVRDSKFPAREPLAFTPGEWAAFLEEVKAGEFDALASVATARLMNAEP